MTHGNAVRPGRETLRAAPPERAVTDLRHLPRPPTGAYRRWPAELFFHP